MEAAGFPTVLVTCFFTIALSMGCNRIVKGVRFHYPFGNPELTPERERLFRKDLVRSALTALTVPVDRQTVFDANTL